MINRSPFSTRRSAVTLVELVVVLAVIGILVGLIAPAVQQVRASAERASCQNRLHQVALALHGFHDTHGAFPTGQDYSVFGDGGDSMRGVSWLAKILPFVDQDALWAQTRHALKEDPVPWNNPPHVGLATVVPTYTCPSDPRVSLPQVGNGTFPPDGIEAAYTSYLGVRSEHIFPPGGRQNGVLPLGERVRIAQITDGTSNTVMVGERPPSARLDSGWWYTTHWSAYSHDTILYAVMVAESPECIPPGGEFVFGPGRLNNQCDMYHFWSLHLGGANFAFADGSVHFLKYTLGAKLRALASRNGGEVVEIP